MLIVHFPGAHHLGREIFNHHVSPRHQAHRQLARLGITQVERDAFFRRVVVSEELALVDPDLAVLPWWSQPQHVGMRARFDSDHVGAVVGEVFGGDWTDRDPGEIQYVNAFQSVGRHKGHSREVRSRRSRAASRSAAPSDPAVRRRFPRCVRRARGAALAERAESWTAWRRGRDK